jgi:hypothetical protein
VAGNPFELEGKFVKIYTYKTIGNVQTFVTHTIKVFEVTQIAYATQPTYELKVEHLENDTIQLPGAGANAIPLIVDGQIKAVTGDPEYNSKTFDPGANSEAYVSDTVDYFAEDYIDTTDSSVSLDYGRILIPSHGFATGDVVIYDPNGYTPIGGMLAYRHYFVKALDQNYIRLYADRINLTRDPATVFARSVNVNISNDTITIPKHGFLTGDLVVYRADSTAIGGLSDRQVYYVIKVDANTIKIAETLIDSDPRYVTDTGAATDYFAEDYVSLTSYNALNLTNQGVGNYHVFTKEYFINFNSVGSGVNHRFIRAMDAEGSGYFANPTVNFISPSGGIGATATTHLTSDGGGVQYVTIDTNGSGYLEADTIVEFDTKPIRSFLYLNDNPTIKYGYISRTLQSVESLGCEGTNPLGFKAGQIYDVVESGSAGAYIYTFTDTTQNYFAGDYVKIGVDNKASVQVVTVNANEEPTSYEIFSGGGEFEQGYFTYTIESPTGSVCMLGLTTGSISSKAGRNKNRQGMPSDINMLQDNYYYQNHSYVIRSKVPQSNWMQMVKDTVHPAGMAVFGELLITASIDLGAAFEVNRQPIDFYEFPVEILMLDDLHTVDFIKALADTYETSDQHVSHVGKTLTDTSNGFSEEVINDVGKGVIDTPIMGDMIDHFDVEKSLLDIPVTTDAIYFGFLRTVSDTFTFNDSSVSHFYKYLDKNVDTAAPYLLAGEDYFAEDYMITPDVILSAIDNASIGVDKSVSDTTSVSESVPYVVFSKQVNDVVTVTENIDEISPMFMIPNDDPIITDVAEVSIHKVLSDGVSISDSSFNETGLAKTDTTYYYEHQHSFHEDVSISSTSGQEVEILHTNEERSSSISKATIENVAASDSGVINIQDYWSGDFASGDYVGAGYSF